MIMEPAPGSANSPDFETRDQVRGETLSEAADIPAATPEAAGISFAESVKLEENLPTLKRLGRTFSISSISLKRENGAPLISLPHPHLDPDAHELARAEAASWAQMTPLIAATLGPLAVLLGIPTLTQPWQGLLLDPPLLPNGLSNYTTLPSPTVNTVLASCTFVSEVLGNAFLILRFSNYHTKLTTWLSFGFWMAKIVFGLANYIQFGITNPETEVTIYLQGYWVSTIHSSVSHQVRSAFAAWQSPSSLSYSFCLTWSSFIRKTRRVYPTLAEVNFCRNSTLASCAERIHAANPHVLFLHRTGGSDILQNRTNDLRRRIVL